MLFVNELEHIETLLKLTDEVDLGVKTKQQLIELTRQQGSKQALGDDDRCCVKSFVSVGMVSVLFENPTDGELKLVAEVKSKNLEDVDKEMNILLKPSSEQFYQFHA